MKSAIFCAVVLLYVAGASANGLPDVSGLINQKFDLLNGVRSHAPAWLPRAAQVPLLLSICTAASLCLCWLATPGGSNL
jgi:hypothetical protein